MPFLFVVVIVAVDAIKKLYKRNNQTGKRGRQKQMKVTIIRWMKRKRVLMRCVDVCIFVTPCKRRFH